MNLTLPIEIGRRYLRRDGKIVTARTGHPSLYDAIAYVGDSEDASRDSYEHVWLRSGLVSKHSETFKMDLIAGPLSDDWIEWGGGGCPVDPETRVALLFRDGDFAPGPHVASTLRWGHCGTMGDIFAYRILAAEQSAQPTGHPHAKLVIEYGNDLLTDAEAWLGWQYRGTDTPDPDWKQCGDHPRWNVLHEYRRAPRTIRIGDREVPEPLRKAPAQGTTCYAAHIGSTSVHVPMTWHGQSECVLALQRGILHLTREAAQAHADALIALSAKGGDHA